MFHNVEQVLVHQPAHGVLLFLALDQIFIKGLQHRIGFLVPVVKKHRVREVDGKSDFDVRRDLGIAVYRICDARCKSGLEMLKAHV